MMMSWILLKLAIIIATLLLQRTSSAAGGCGELELVAVVAGEPTPLPRVRVCRPGNSRSSTTATSGIATWTRDVSCDGSHRVFKPRGANYIRLNQTSIGRAPDTQQSTLHADVSPGNAYHSTFSLGHWNATEADDALRRIAALSYDLVRVFIDDGRTLCGLTTMSSPSVAAPGSVGLVPVIPCTAATSRPNGVNGPFYGVDSQSGGSIANVGGSNINNTTEIEPHPEWLSGEYMDNFAEFVRLATVHGVYIMPTLQRYPCNAHFLNLTQPADERISEGNADYLHLPTVRAKAT